MILDTRAVDMKLRDFEFKCGYEIDLWDKCQDYETDEECEELENNMTEWVKENVAGHAMYHHNFRWGFEKQEDLVAFKLMWG